LANVHNLKTWPQFFKEVKNGNKPFEVRKNDRHFEVGDTLILEEYDPNKGMYTGAWLPVLVTYKLDDIHFVKENFVILGIKDIKF
jgi:hypothetical protein